MFAAFISRSGVGERTREGNDLYREMIETGVVNLEGDSKVALVFHDEEGQDVLLFIDNVFRFTQTGSEVSALLGRIHSAVGYQPTLSADMGGMLVPSATRTIHR